ncbi:MAG: polysaccharide biosynthesis/export family protein [Spirulinaceae cyanobacterium]
MVSAQKKRICTLFVSSAMVVTWADIGLGQTIPVPSIETPSRPIGEFIPEQPPTTFGTEGQELLPPADYSPRSCEQDRSIGIYRLGISDSVNVTVPFFPEFSGGGTLDLEGNVLLPIIGKVPLLGLTLNETQNRIAAELRRFLVKETEVIVSLAGLRPAEITVGGEIVRPGYYPLGTGSQLATVITAAGGSTGLADLRSIIVRRILPTDGSVIECQVDLFTPLQNGMPLPNVRLQDGDAVIVSRIELGQDQGYDSTLVARSNLAQPQITIRVLSYPNNGIGTISLANGSTFLDALSSVASNITQANVNEIALIRFDQEQGKAVTQVLNGRAALFGDISQDVPLQDNDVIVVGRTLVAKVTNALNVFTQPFRDILGFLLFFDSLAESADNLFAPNNPR